MDAGYKKIEEIARGDKVLAYDEETRFRQGSRAAVQKRDISDQ